MMGLPRAILTNDLNKVTIAIIVMVLVLIGGFFSLEFILAALFAAHPYHSHLVLFHSPALPAAVVFATFVALVLFIIYLIKRES
jgi:membrane protein implicated in regulation of membrane protease activity